MKELQILNARRMFHNDSAIEKNATSSRAPIKLPRKPAVMFLPCQGWLL
jgi:hypothetical protein